MLNAYKKSNKKLEKYKKDIVQQCGFCADPNVPCWKNVEDYMFGMSVSEWFARPTNTAYHDY